MHNKDYDEIEISRFLRKTLVEKKLYKNVSNITELKIKLLPDNKDNIEVTEGIVNFFNQDEEVIMSYLSKYGKKFKADFSGAIVKYPNNQLFKKLHTRIISLDSQWEEAKNWVIFYIELGKYLNNVNEIKLFINYIDITIPATLIATGFLNEYFKNSQLEKEDLVSVVERGFIKGEIVSVKDENNWYRGEVIRIEDIKGKEKFNPYVVIKYKPEGQQDIIISVPHLKWGESIRKGGVVKGTRGRGNKVEFQDRISNRLNDRYGDSMVTKLRISPEIMVNLIGRGIDKDVRDVLKNIQFSDEEGVFMMTDLLYLNNDNESNYVNVNMINSLIYSNQEVNQDSISIFFGADDALKFREYQTNKNIFLTSRIRKHYIDETLLLLNELEQNSNLSAEEKYNETRKIVEYMKGNNIEIPKGVELYVY